jgi:hypothetical protein
MMGGKITTKQPAAGEDASAFIQHEGNMDDLVSSRGFIVVFEF